MNRWYESPKLVFFVFMIISLIFLLSAVNMEVGNGTTGELHVFSVEFEYFGFDSETIERRITIPFEEAVSQLPDLFEIKSFSDQNTSLSTLYFYPQANEKLLYIHVRSIVDDFYNTLPKDIQKPRIYSSANKEYLINVAFVPQDDPETLKLYLEQEVKPLLERIDGVSQVKILGGKTKEVRVVFDGDKMSGGSIDPRALGQIFQRENIISEGSTISVHQQDVQVLYDTRLKSLEEMRNLPVDTGKGIHKVSDYSQVHFDFQDENEIVRIDGKQALSVLINTTYKANSIRVSQACKEVLDGTKLDYIVLYDKGKDVQENIFKVFIATLQSLIIIIILVFLFFSKITTIMLIFFFLWATMLWTWGIMAFCGITMNENTLSGITIALGLVVDAFFVLMDIINTPGISVYEKVKKLHWGVWVSCLTSVLVLVPVYFLEGLIPGIRDIAITIGCMIICGTVLALYFFPPFVHVQIPIPTGECRQPRFAKNIVVSILGKKEYSGIFSSYCLKKFFKIMNFLTNHRGCCKLFFYAMALLPLCLYFLSEKNFSVTEKDQFVSITVEYDGNMAKNTIDKEITGFTEALKKISGVKNIFTKSVTGQATMDIAFDEKKITWDTLLKEVNNKKNLITKGYVYVPENTKEKEVFKITGAVIGDDVAVCKESAKKLLTITYENPKILQSVLHFKEAEEFYKVEPDKIILSKNNVSVQDVAVLLRWILYGPVVDKWINQNREMDIRIVSNRKGNTTGQTLNTITIPFATVKREDTGLHKSFPLASVASIKKETGFGVLYRQDCRPCAYFTLFVSASSTEKAIKEVNSLFEKTPLEKGYIFQISKDLENYKKKYTVLWASFVLSIIGIFLLFLALIENFKAIILTLIIPVSLAFPLLIKAFLRLPWESGDLVGMVIVSGLAVNNGIYLFESDKSDIIIKILDKGRVIIVTSVSSMMGCVPLFFSAAEGFVKSLAFFVFWGIGGSLFISLFLFPLIFWNPSTTVREK